MDLLSRIAAELDCVQLVHEYANRLDAYDHDGFMQLWAEDGVLAMLGTEHRGPAAIRRWLEGREQGMICRHLVTNTVIRPETESSASGSCYTLAFRAGQAADSPPGALVNPTFLVSYRDRFMRDGERGWLLARREVVADLVGPDQMRALLLGARATAS
ncbi:nuclear transport factor 2 family protein [Aquibium microcysteis]|uniref:nuclear transport factor 2 family protein n=1 Tax=Aquibium microcysteis TaxID=675281 RepID=UPI00165D1AAF|nr:nuclear transport factor 2 family protein [Aquibium microcysteis]